MPRKKLANRDYYDDSLDFDDTSSQSSKNGNPPIQRNAANARERARMRVLSSAFGRLKTKLPNIPPDTKLSKLDTLRLATIYIKQLKGALDNETSSTACTFAHNAYSIGMQEERSETNTSSSVKSSTGMSWPFEFHLQPYVNKEQTMPQSSPVSNNNNNNNNTHSYTNDMFCKYAYTTNENASDFYESHTHQNNNYNLQRNCLTRRQFDQKASMDRETYVQDGATNAKYYTTYFMNEHSENLHNLIERN